MVGDMIKGKAVVGKPEKLILYRLIDEGAKLHKLVRIQIIIGHGKPEICREEKLSIPRFPMRGKGLTTNPENTVPMTP